MGRNKFILWPWPLNFYYSVGHLWRSVCSAFVPSLQFVRPFVGNYSTFLVWTLCCLVTLTSGPLIRVVDSWLDLQLDPLTRTNYAFLTLVLVSPTWLPIIRPTTLGYAHRNVTFLCFFMTTTVYCNFNSNFLTCEWTFLTRDDLRLGCQSVRKESDSWLNVCEWSTSLLLISTTRVFHSWYGTDKRTDRQTACNPQRGRLQGVPHWNNLNTYSEVRQTSLTLMA